MRRRQPRQRLIRMLGERPCGFVWGAAEVQRVASFDTGHVVIAVGAGEVKQPPEGLPPYPRVEVTVSPTGERLTVRLVGKGITVTREGAVMS